MTTSNWQATRQKYIGASEVAALYGVGYESAYSLWAKKSGLLPKEESDDERLYWGKKIEPVIIQGLLDRLSIACVPWPQDRFVANTRCDGLGCTPDAVIESSFNACENDGVVEIKNVGEYMSSEWKDGVPLRFQCQCQAQIATLDCDYAIVAALVGGNRLVTHRIERHDAFIADLYKRVNEFWRQVEANEPPPVDGSRQTTEALRILHPADNGETVQLGDDFAELADEAAALGRVIKQAEDRKAEIDNKIRAAIGDNTYGILPSGAKWAWKTQERKGYTVGASVSRVLRFSKAKE